MAKAGVCMISDFYDQTFTVTTPSTTVSDMGSPEPTWSTAGTFKGWIDKVTGQEQSVGAQYLGVVTHVIGCSSTNTWILKKHRIVDADSLIFRVVDTDNPVKRYHHLEILLVFNGIDQLST